jgi:hypothetical protein
MKPIYTEYENWGPMITELPPRSRLFPLIPVGIGTGQSESLTSYIIRLAETHCLYVTTLYSLILHPAVRAEIENQSSEETRAVLKWAHGITRNGHTWNGVSEVASCHARAIERLTGVKDLHLLTWLPWEAALSHHLRQRRAWCPACFSQWRNEGQTIYEPLLWTLQIVKICPIHHCPLVEVCPCCGQENQLLNNKSRAGYCSYCRQRLSDLGEDRLPSQHQAENEQLRVAQSAAEMIGRAPDLANPPSKTLIQQNLRDLINHLGGNCKAFGEVIGRRHNVICSWRDGKHVPRLETLMEICHRLNLSIVDFLTVPIEMNGHQSKMKELFFRGLNFSKRHKLQGKRASGASPAPQTLPKKKGVSQIRQLLERELDKEYPRSADALAREAGYKSAAMIYKSFSDLFRTIIAKRKEYRAGAHERRRQVVAEALKEIPMPTMKEIAARLRFRAPDYLYPLFPDECRALSQRRAQERESRLAEMETHLRAALSEEPPRPLRHVAASHGYGLCEVYGNHNELCLAISARYAAYQKEETVRRRLALKEWIRQIAVDIQPSEISQSANQIKPLAPDLRLSTIKRVLREIEREKPEE